MVCQTRDCFVPYPSDSINPYYESGVYNYTYRVVEWNCNGDVVIMHHLLLHLHIALRFRDI